MSWTNTLMAFSLAIISSMMAVRLILLVSKKGRVLDDPIKRDDDPSRKIHSTPLPRIGGVGLFLGFLIATLAFNYSSTRALLVTALSFLALLLGLADDILVVKAKLRLVLQILLAAISVWLLDLPLNAIYMAPFPAFSLHPIFGWAIAMFFIVGAINTINMIDGLDGLAAGVMTISFVLLGFVYATTVGNFLMFSLICLPLIGSLLGFLHFNRHPARIFLGDGGAYWLGFMAAVFMLDLLKQKSSLPIQSVILCMAVPILDTLAVIIARIRQGLSPMHGDSRHLHHALLKIGIHHHNSVTTIYFLSVVIGISGIIPALYPQYSLWWIYYLSIFMLGLFIIFSHKIDRNLVRSVVEYKRATYEKYGVVVRVLVRFLDGILRSCIYVILLLAPIFSGTVFKDFAIYAAMICGLILIMNLVKERNLSVLSQTFVALGVTLILLTINQSPLRVQVGTQWHNIQYLYNILFYTLFGAGLLYIALTFRRRYLVVNLLDFLVIVVPLLLLLLPEEIVQRYKLNVVSLRALVLLPIINILGKKGRQSYEKIELVTIFSLILIMIMGFLKVRILIY